MKRYLIQQKDSADTEVEGNADQPTTSKHQVKARTQLGSTVTEKMRLYRKNLKFNRISGSGLKTFSMKMVCSVVSVGSMVNPHHLHVEHG